MDAGMWSFGSTEHRIIRTQLLTHNQQCFKCQSHLTAAPQFQLNAHQRFLNCGKNLSFLKRHFSICSLSIRQFMRLFVSSATSQERRATSARTVRVAPRCCPVSRSHCHLRPLDRRSDPSRLRDQTAYSRTFTNLSQL